MHKNTELLGNTMVITKNSPKSNAQEDYKYLARKPYNTIKNLRVTQES